MVVTLVKVQEWPNTVYSYISITRVISLSRVCEYSTSNLFATLLFDTLYVSPFETLPDMMLYPVLLVPTARNIMVHSFYVILRSIAVKYMHSLNIIVYPNTSSADISKGDRQ